MTRLTFACELETPKLAQLFADDSVLQALRALNASVSVALRDRSTARAGVIRKLNQANIPVVAWLLLSEREGYWLHAAAATHAERAYVHFNDWTAKENLSWAGIGLDLEPDLVEVRQLLGGGRLEFAKKAWRRLRTRRAFELASLAYSDLVARMRADGYPVESYNLPFIADERDARSTLLQRMAGVVDVPADDEIFMLYSSYLRRYGAGLIEAYGRDAPSIGVGSTGGDIPLPGAERFAPLTWDELARDLRMARRFTDHIFLFSLEGCVAGGYLDRLIDFDWTAAGTTCSPSTRRAHRLRLGIRGFLTLARWSPWILLLCASLLCLILLLLSVP